MRRLTIRVLSGLITVVILGSVLALLALPSANATSWSSSVLLTPSSKVYFGLDLQIGSKNVYVLTTAYYGGPITLFKSGINDAKWSTMNILEYGEYDDPGMCAYKNGSSDDLLLAYGPGVMLKSIDSGNSFNYLSTLPLTPGADSWRFIGIGTNASWLGTPDSNVYVVGSQRFGGDYGTYVVSFTKSTDGGRSWQDPVLICGLEQFTKFPQLVGDGKNLYVIYSDSGSYANTDLYIRMSSDWGATWSPEKVLLSKDAGSAWMCAYSLQNLGKGKALLTSAEYWADQWPNGNPVGRYGYLNYSDLTYKAVGEVSGGDWNVAGGFAGKMSGSEFRLAWIKGVGHPYTEVMYTSSKNTGLEAPALTPNHHDDNDQGENNNDQGQQAGNGASGAQTLALAMMGPFTVVGWIALLSGVGVATMVFATKRMRHQ